jgi:hypothetical protein
MSVLQKLPAQIQMLDLDPSYPHRFHDLLPPNYEGEPLLTQKPAVTKLVTTGELVDWSIDEIVRKFPGLQDLQVSGPMDLEHLVRKCASLKALTSLVIFKNSTTSFIRPSSKEESLAQVPESPSVKRVSFTHPGFLNMKVVMLVVCKFPKLESLEFRNCTLAGTDFDRAVFHWTQDSYVELAIFNKEEIASMRDKFKQVPNCFNDECWNQLAELFAPAKQGQQAVAALDAPAAEKQQEGKKE